MRTLFGFLIVLFGLQLLLEANGVANVPSVGDWWPVILIAVGFLSWRSNPRIVFWPMVVVALGVLFLLENLGVLSFNIWNLVWPVLIIVFGLHLLFGRKDGSIGTAHESSGREVTAVFSGRNEVVHGAFSDGKVTAIFGGTKLDLRSATFGATARLEVFAAFGGAEILVPKNVQVTVKVTPLFGGSENKTSVDSSAATTLTVSGTALFGGVDIKN